MAMGFIKGEGFAVDASVMEANASRYRGKAPEDLAWTDKQRQMRAVAEYLAALDEVAEPNPDRKPPKVISPSDPSSAWTAKANKRVQFGYGLNYLIDIENAVIVDVEATPARTYASSASISSRSGSQQTQKDKKITPHIPVRDKSDRDDNTFSRSDFHWDKRRGIHRGAVPFQLARGPTRCLP